MEKKNLIQGYPSLYRWIHHPCELGSATLADIDPINPKNLLVDCWTLLDNLQNLLDIIFTVKKNV